MALRSPDSDTTPADSVNDPLTSATNAYDGNTGTFATGSAVKGKKAGRRFTKGAEPPGLFPRQGIYVGVEIDWDCTAIDGGSSRISHPTPSGSTIIVDRTTTFSRVTERFLYPTNERDTEVIGTSADIYAVGGPQGSGVGLTTMHVWEIRFLFVSRGEITVIDG